MSSLQKKIQKFLISGGIIFLLFICVVFTWRLVFPKHTLDEYYSLMNEQEHISENEFIDLEFK
jgi:hypothetical protein